MKINKPIILFLISLVLAVNLTFASKGNVSNASHLGSTYFSYLHLSNGFRGNIKLKFYSDSTYFLTLTRVIHDQRILKNLALGRYEILEDTLILKDTFRNFVLKFLIKDSVLIATKPNFAFCIHLKVKLVGNSDKSINTNYSIGDSISFSYLKEHWDSKTSEFNEIIFTRKGINIFTYKNVKLDLNRKKFKVFEHGLIFYRGKLVKKNNLMIFENVHLNTVDTFEYKRVNKNKILIKLKNSKHFIFNT